MLTGIIILALVLINVRILSTIMMRSLVLVHIIVLIKPLSPTIAVDQTSLLVHVPAGSRRVAGLSLKHVG